MKSTPIYRAVMQAIEARRLELGIAMATVDDLAGTQDGYYAKMLYPDTPSGKCAGWATVELVVQALFGRDYGISFSGDPAQDLAALRFDKGASHKYLEIRHWRHSKHFKKIGSNGGIARAAKLSAERRQAIAMKASRAAKRARKARRQGQQHRLQNAAKSNETGPATA